MKFPRYQIPLDEEYTTFMFRREYISHLYGGNTQAMLPDIAPDKIALHGVNDFMMITLDFNPHAPVNPGDPGLFYRVIKARKWSRCTARDLLAAEQNEEEEEKGKEHTPERLFVRICNNLWMYMGMYQLIPIDSLSTEEYCLQSPVNKREWTNQIMDKKGAKGIRARIALRSRLGREPTLSEVRKAVNDRALLDSVTPVQIESAYSKGEEEIGVWCMKCVGYDVEFQKLLVRNYSKWLNDPEVRNANKKLRAQTTRGPKTNAPKRTTKVAGQKRKRRGIGGKALVSDLDHSDSASDVEEIRYVPRSTRARPIIMPE
ncbi:hypothetical protein EW026_g616 [Hermanssonia centrifuga]|uniref:DUF6697 domain-containing protein n=1 Tax=Hermanssonia centrifuga TaxID=98765 RepID=A0A4S4KU81_9APHY|nr:hypothetical protein EW026_g616 [Hermanssonia centrifuga]